MNCPLESRENTQWLLDYGSGKPEAEPAAGVRGIMERHVAGCDACREFVRGQRAVWQALDAWEAAPVSADFDRRLSQRIDAQASWGERFLRQLPLRRTMPAAAMAGLLVMAGILLERAAVSPAPPSEILQVDAVQPEQVEHALDSMELLSEFSRHVRTEGPGSKL